MCWINPAFANTCTWVSTSTKSWSDATAWTLCGSVAPTAADDVVVAGTGTLTIDGTSGAPSLARSVNFTGFTGTVTHASAKQLNIGDGTAGALTLVSGMTYAPDAASLIKFVSTTTGNNITTGTKRIGPVTFDGVGGGWTFQDAFNPVAGTTITLTNGSLDTNGQAVGASSGVMLSSSNSNTRSLTLGATTWSAPNTTATTWDIGTSTGMTLSAAGSTINLANSTSSPTFNGGGLTYGIVTSTVLTTGTFTINGANTFATLTTSSGAGTSGSYRFSANQTVTGTHTANGNSNTNRTFLRSATRATQYQITAATFAFTYLDIQDIAGVDSGGADSRNLSAVTGGAGDGGNNSGWTFSTPKNCYLVTGVSINDTASNYFTTSGGATPISPVIPMIHDTTIVDANSITAGSVTITMLRQRKSGINMTGVTNNPALSWTTNSVEYYGNMLFTAGHTISGTANPVFAANTGVAQSLTTGGNTITWRIGVDKGGTGAAHTLTLADATTSNVANNITSGILTNSTTYSGTAIVQTGGIFRPAADVNMSANHGALSGGSWDSPNYTITLTADTFQWNSSGTCNVKGILGTTTFNVNAGTVTVGTSGLTYTSTPTVTGTGTLTSTGLATFTPTTMSVAAAGGSGLYNRIWGNW